MADIETRKLLEEILTETRETKTLTRQLVGIAEEMLKPKPKRNYNRANAEDPTKEILGYIEEEMGIGKRIMRGDLYDKVCAKCRRDKQKIPTRNEFYKAVRKAGYGELRSNGGRYFFS